MRTLNILADPEHDIQAWGGVADFWYVDDGDILCQPQLVHQYLCSYDRQDAAVGGVRNRTKSEVIQYVNAEELEAHAEEWQVEAVRALATVSTAVESGLTLGIATGSIDAIERQLQQKVSLILNLHILQESIKHLDLD